jgi:hypothetical protein
VATSLVKFSNGQLNAIDWLDIRVLGGYGVKKTGDITLGGVELLGKKHDLARKISINSRGFAVEHRFP